MLNVREITDNEWDIALQQWPESNFLQSSNWRNANKKNGKSTEAIAIFEGDSIVGLISIVIQDAKRGRYGEIAGGPLIDWQNQSLVSYALSLIRSVGIKYRTNFIRIRPQVLLDNDSKILIENKLKKAPMHLHAEHTSILDITPSEDEILAKMRRQTRYEIRKSARMEIDVTECKASDDIENFILLQKDTASRQGFITSSPMFLKNIAEAFGDQAKIYTSQRDGVVLNKALILYSGQEVDYFEAASSSESYKFPGSYGLLWRVINDAKRDEYSRLNLWGISYSNTPDNRYAGVTTFKKGFGGEDVVYEPAHDMVLNPIRYSVNWVLETARRKRRKL